MSPEPGAHAPSAAPVRVLMWSGPRNISTAMMRSWGSRPDTAVCDEPLYAHYLKVTGAPHPGREEVLAHHEGDWRRVVDGLLGPIPGGKPVWYQKHMAHHLVGDIARDWLLAPGLVHAFLVREPTAMAASLLKVTPGAGLDDTGLPQQVELFRLLRGRTGRVPPIVDARDVLENPRGMLTALCAAVGVAFDERMLTWAPGRRETDGVWARHWYAAVERSTGFEPARPADEPVPPAARALGEACLPLYRELWDARLRA